MWKPAIDLYWHNNNNNSNNNNNNDDVLLTVYPPSGSSPVKNYSIKKEKLKYTTKKEKKIEIYNVKNNNIGL